MTAEILAQLDVIKAPNVAAIAAADAIPALVDAAELSAESIGFEKGRVAGIEEGKAMIELPDATDPDAKYTQEQMNSAVNSAVATKEAEMQIKINELVGKVEALEAATSGHAAAVEAARAEGAQAKHAEIMADYKSTKVDDAAFEAKHSI